MVLKNEYGVRIGSLNYDNFSDTHGSIDIEKIKYRFHFRQVTAHELHVYKGSRKDLIYSCQLSIENNISKTALASLIIAISWYLFLKEVSKDHHAFNEVIIS